MRQNAFSFTHPLVITLPACGLHQVMSRQADGTWHDAGEKC